MKNKELKLYNKYKHNDYPNIEFIYIGIDYEKEYWFIYKDYHYNFNVDILNNYGLNSEKIIKDLNLKTYIDKNSKKYIKEYFRRWFNEEDLINFKHCLKDKLKNIMNR